MDRTVPRLERPGEKTPGSLKIFNATRDMICFVHTSSEFGRGPRVNPANGRREEVSGEFEFATM